MSGHTYGWGLEAHTQMQRMVDGCLNVGLSHDRLTLTGPSVNASRGNMSATHAYEYTCLLQLLRGR